MAPRPLPNPEWLHLKGENDKINVVYDVSGGQGNEYLNRYSNVVEEAISCEILLTIDYHSDVDDEIQVRYILCMRMLFLQYPSCPFILALWGRISGGQTPDWKARREWNQSMSFRMNHAWCQVFINVFLIIWPWTPCWSRFYCTRRKNVRSSALGIESAYRWTF